MDAIVECLSCHTRVIPSGDGVCPACKAPIGAADERDASKTLFAIAHASQLAPICCSCGLDTQRFVKVQQSIRVRSSLDSSSLLLSLMMLLLGWVTLPIAWAAGLLDPARDAVVVRMPQCEACAVGGHPAPVRVNAEELRMTFLVHSRFKQANADAH